MDIMQACYLSFTLEIISYYSNKNQGQKISKAFLINQNNRKCKAWIVAGLILSDKLLKFLTFLKELRKEKDAGVNVKMR